MKQLFRFLRNWRKVEPEMLKHFQAGKWQLRYMTLRAAIGHYFFMRRMTPTQREYWNTAATAHLEGKDTGEMISIVGTTAQQTYEQWRKR